MSTVLVVDDDLYIRELICKLLKDEGFDILEAEDGNVALKLLGEQKIDMCVLDVMMPNMDGYEFCRLARKYYDFPILFLTAKSETSQKVKGFKLGADDYLVKPFDPEELMVRIRALMKRYNISCAQSVKIGSVTVDKESYTIIAGGIPSDVPLKEFDLLFLLASYQGKTLTRDRLIEEVWGYDFDGNERTLDVHIGRLRERFPAEEYGFKIATIRGLGYRLEVPHGA